jgi:hypothetical protein
MRPFHSRHTRYVVFILWFIGLYKPFFFVGNASLEHMDFFFLREMLALNISGEFIF